MTLNRFLKCFKSLSREDFYHFLPQLKNSFVVSIAKKMNKSAFICFILDSIPLPPSFGSMITAVYCVYKNRSFLKMTILVLKKETDSSIIGTLLYIMFITTEIYMPCSSYYILALKRFWLLRFKDDVATLFPYLLCLY